jgi:hypothetical protein
MFKCLKGYGIPCLPSILHVKCGTVLGVHFAPVVEADGGDVCVSEPFLHLGYVRPSFERAFVAAVTRIECTQIPIASPQDAGTVVCHRAEERRIEAFVTYLRAMFLRPS